MKKFTKQLTILNPIALPLDGWKDMTYSYSWERIYSDWK